MNNSKRNNMKKQAAVIMETNKRVTAVEWLIKEWPILESQIPPRIIDQAKAMEKEQIMKAVDVGFEEGSKFPEDIKLNDAEQYYTNTFTEPKQ
jgi:hypothetical protein